MPVATLRETLVRLRTIITTDADVTDSGWGDWNSFISVDWLLPGYASRFGSSFTKTECLIEVADGIGRPWKLIWRDMITDGTTFDVSYSSENEQLFLPGTTASVTYDAADGTYLQFGTGAALVPADGM